MGIIKGNLYFIKDEFFEMVNDSFLKVNYENTKRPHYLALQVDGSELLWVVPCSSKIEKFENIVKEKKGKGKPTDGIKIVTIFDKKAVLLFQDMFPIIEKYIQEPYIKGGQAVGIFDTKSVNMLEHNAKKVVGLLTHGVKFTPTQPNVLKIIELLNTELKMEMDNSIREYPLQNSMCNWIEQIAEMREQASSTKESSQVVHQKNNKTR